MDKPLIKNWAMQHFSKPVVLVLHNNYNAKMAKTIYTSLVVFWLLLIAGSAYYFIYINGNETQMKLFGLIAFVLAVISVIILISVWNQGTKTIKIDSTGIYTAKGSCYGWVNLSSVWFSYTVGFGKTDPHSLTLHFDKHMATINKKDSHFPRMWSVLETVPTRQENHFYGHKRSRTQVVREA